jgi:hypothetical protein
MLGKGSRPPATAELSSALAQLQSLIANNRELDPVSKSALSAKIAEVKDVIDAPPTSLADGGKGSLAALQEADVGGEGSDAIIDAAFEPGEREHLEHHWMLLCWCARHDMCEEEMLVLTEKTFRKLVACYNLPNAEALIKFWAYLVKLRQENKRIQSACANSVEHGSKPRERNAGDVVTASALASQRTKALPSGIESGVYNPEVLSPTAQLWAKAPTERAASLRRSTERAASLAGGTVKASPSGRKGGDGASSSPGSFRAKSAATKLNLNGTDKVQGTAVVDANNPLATRRNFGKGFRNPKGWARF